MPVDTNSCLDVASFFKYPVVNTESISSTDGAAKMPALNLCVDVFPFEK